MALDRVKRRVDGAEPMLHQHRPHGDLLPVALAPAICVHAGDGSLNVHSAFVQLLERA